MLSVHLFHSNDFPESAYLPLIPIAYKTFKFGLNWSTMKGTLLEEHNLLGCASSSIQGLILKLLILPSAMA